MNTGPLRKGQAQQAALISVTACNPSLLNDWERFQRVASEAMMVNDFHDLHSWLQGDFKYFLPHDILVVVSGDSRRGNIGYKVLSGPAGKMTSYLDRELLPFAQEMHQRWIIHRELPPDIGHARGEVASRAFVNSSFLHVQGRMWSVLSQGTSYKRSRGECLYVALCDDAAISAHSQKMLEILLPYVDTARWRIAYLLREKPAANFQLPASAMAANGLSARECEILEWMRKGKTNQEIALILKISFFTVKNHLQRMFLKLDVLNRAQAVGKFTPKN